MLITLERFIRAYAVRKKDQFLNPPINEMKDFVLPRNSQLHYFGKDGDDIGIVATNPLLAYLTTGQPVVEFVVGYSNDKAGGFKKVTTDSRQMVLAYFKRNKALANANIAKSQMLLEKNLLVTNYGLQNVGVTYLNSPIAWWKEYQNRWNSTFEHVVKAATSSRRNQFVIIDIPDMFPSISQMRKFVQTPTSISEIKRIGNTPRMMITQWFAWFDATADSIYPRDVNINNRIHYIFRYQDKWICVNPNLLMSFMKTPNNPKGAYSQLQTRKNFLIMLLTMVIGNVDGVFIDEDEPDELTAAELDEVSKEDLEKKVFAKTGTTFGAVNKTKADETKEKLSDAFDKLLDAAENEDESTELDKNKDKRVERVLDNLERVNVDIVDNEESTGGEEKQQVIDRDDIDVPEDTAPIVDYKEYQPTNLGLEETFNAKVRTHFLKGNITPQQVRRLEKLGTSYKTIPNPEGGSGTLESAALIEPKDLEISKDDIIIDKITMVADESMLKSTLVNFDKQYIEKVMRKDIYNAVLNIQKHGIAVQDYKVQRVDKLGDAYDVHSVRLVPIDGAPSTLTFKTPVVDASGVFQSRSVRLKMKKQRVDIPLRKVGPDEVAMTSYMSKMFVETSQFSAYSSEKWLRGQFVALNDPKIKLTWGSSSLIAGGNPNEINKLKGAKFAVAAKRTPLLYSQIAKYLKSIKTDKYEMFFDVSKLEEHFGDEVVKAFESTRDTQVLLGKGKNSLLILTNAGIVHEASITEEKNVELGHLTELLGIDTAKMPVDCADIVMVSQQIPLGVLMGYYLGLGNLIKTLKVRTTFIPKGTRGVTNIPNSVSIAFADGTLVCEVQGNYKAQLILGGFNRYKKHIARFPMVEYDKPNVYGTVFADAGLPARFMREFNILRNLWVDPITRDELIRMGEPTDFILLLLRAVEMLEYGQHPEEMDRAFQRDRGYERISGFVYNELIKGVRAFDSTPVRAKAKLTMNPEAVWMTMIGDETVAPIEESNPVHNLKESEAVVYRGSGGRSSRTMNANSRKFSKNAVGVDSESTVDNGDAGTVRFLTANPNYNSVRGTSGILETFDSSVNSSCMNTSLLLAPAADLDD